MAKKQTEETMKKLLEETIEFCDEIISHSQPESIHLKKAMKIKAMAVDLLLDFNYFANRLNGLERLKKDIED